MGELLALHLARKAMTQKTQPFEYESVAPATRRRARPRWDDESDDPTWLAPSDEEAFARDEAAAPVAPPRASDDSEADARVTTTHDSISSSAASSRQPALAHTVNPAKWSRIKRGHALSFLGLFLFTLVVYVRPYELSASLAWLQSSAYWLAIATLIAFVPAQLASEGTLTARPREVNLVLLLGLIAFLSIPVGISPADSWTKFMDFLKVLLMFIVMVNVTRTESRLRAMWLLVLAVSLVLSLNAINDYWTGNFALGNIRIKGIFGNLFDNPNDLALHLVTMVFLAFGLALAAGRATVRKVLYGLCALAMLAGMVVTFSRGGFLALIGGMLLVAWKLGRRNRALVMLTTLFFAVALFLFAPGGYGARLFSMVDRDLDTGSVASRQNLLFHSLLVSARHPLLGIGIGNFPIVSDTEQVTHNAYTEVSSETGMIALVCYVLFMVTALKRLRKIERETEGDKDRRSKKFYYLAVGLQASLVSYMIASFFASVAYKWNIYYLISYAVCLDRIYEASARRKELMAAKDAATEANRIETDDASGSFPQSARENRARA